MKIAFVYAGGREARWSAARAGECPSDFFYGAVELARAGHDVTCVDVPEKASPLAAAYNVLFSGRTPARTSGDHVLGMRGVLPRLKTAEVVVAASTAHANALAMWQAVGGYRGRLIGIHCGMVNHLLNGARRKATGRAMRRQEVVLFAEPEREECIRQFALDATRVHVSPFGVDAGFWTPGKGEKEFILAVGNDGRRDYATFLEAVANSAIPVKIVTARPLPANLPPQVEHLRGSWKNPAVTDEGLRDLYRRALVVVVPLEDALQPSGQSVALQAMACGRPVIMSRTRGLWIGSDFAEGRDLLLVPPSSPREIQGALRILLEDSSRRECIGAAAREAVLRHGRIERFAAGIGALLEP